MKSSQRTRRSHTLGAYHMLGAVAGVGMFGKISDGPCPQGPPRLEMSTVIPADSGGGSKDTQPTQGNVGQRHGAQRKASRKGSCLSGSRVRSRN